MSGVTLIYPGDGGPFWLEVMKAPGDAIAVNTTEQLLEHVKTRDVGVVVLPWYEAAANNWALCKKIREMAADAYIVVVTAALLCLTEVPEEVDEFINPADIEDALARIRVLRELGAANTTVKRNGCLGLEPTLKKLVDGRGFLPPSKIRCQHIIDGELVQQLNRALVTVTGCTVAFVPAAAKPPCEGEAADGYVETAEDLPCTALLARRPQGIGFDPCREARWQSMECALREKRPVIFNCPGGLLLHAYPVYLEFREVRYPLGALTAGVGEVFLLRGLEGARSGSGRGWVRLAEQAALARRYAGSMAKTGAASDLVKACADYIGRDASYRYNVAYELYLQMGTCRESGYVYLAGRPLDVGIQQVEKLATIGKLAAGIIHEIKNPLTSIRGFIQLLAERKSVEPQDRQYLDVILGEIDRVSDILKNFLYFARPQEPRSEEIDLNKVLKDVLVLVENDAYLRKIAVTSECAADLPPIVADPEQMKQLILNLVQNAFQAMPEGGCPLVAHLFSATGKCGCSGSGGYGARHTGGVHTPAGPPFFYHQTRWHWPGPGHLPADCAATRRGDGGMEQGRGRYLLYR